MEYDDAYRIAIQPKRAMDGIWMAREDYDRLMQIQADLLAACEACVNYFQWDGDRFERWLLEERLELVIAKAKAKT